MRSGTVWVVGKSLHNRHEDAWELVGVFTSEKLAIDACGGHWDYFVGPVIINKAFPDGPTKWDGAYYPAYIKAKESE